MNVPQPAMQPKRLSLNAIVTFLKNYWVIMWCLFLVAVIIVHRPMAKVWVRANVPLGGDWLPGQAGLVDALCPHPFLV